MYDYVLQQCKIFVYRLECCNDLFNCPLFCKKLFKNSMSFLHVSKFIEKQLLEFSTNIRFRFYSKSNILQNRNPFFRFFSFTSRTNICNFKNLLSFFYAILNFNKFFQKIPHRLTQINKYMHLSTHFQHTLNPQSSNFLCT